MWFQKKLNYMDIHSKRTDLCTICILIIMFLLFVLVLSRLYKTSTIYKNVISSSKNDSLNWISYLLTKTDNRSEIITTVERIARRTVNVTNAPKSKNYYEEQRAVIVNAESITPPYTSAQSNIGSESYDYSDTNDYRQLYSGERQYNNAESEQNGYAEELRDNTYARSFNDQQHYRSPYALWSYSTTNSNRPPFSAYDNYDDMISEYDIQSKPKLNQLSPTKISTAVQGTENPALTFVTILKSIKQMWDIYQVLASAWNAMNSHYRQRQNDSVEKNVRINSRKPPFMESTSSLTNTPRSSKAGTLESITNVPLKKKTSEIVTVGLKGDRGSNEDVLGLRAKRQTSINEARYIKGDPLKGYYDFVITEGSYKFWAVFQVGTAILIIYSTFAAIYYSKVNPLVGDYDYQDYLGGARSLSNSDLDFVDDDELNSRATSSWYNWVPRTSHSLKFILEAIDKIPAERESEEDLFTVKGETNM